MYQREAKTVCQDHISEVHRGWDFETLEKSSVDLSFPLHKCRVRQMKTIAFTDAVGENLPPCMRMQTRMRDCSHTIHTTWKGVHQWLFSLTCRRSTASLQSFPTSPCWKHSQRRCHLGPSVPSFAVGLSMDHSLLVLGWPPHVQHSLGLLLSYHFCSARLTHACT